MENRTNSASRRANESEDQIGLCKLSGVVLEEEKQGNGPHKDKEEHDLRHNTPNICVFKRD